MMYHQTTHRCLWQSDVLPEELWQCLAALDCCHLRWQRQVVLQLQTAQVRTPPLLFGPQWQRQLLALLPGGKTSVAHPHWFVLQGAESFDSLSVQRLYTYSHNTSSSTSAYPTEPSIWSSISRFISTAYSIGSSFTSGSINPLTIIVEASVSD